MSLSDIAPEGRDEFYAWHGHEHIPERVGMLGFQRGRGYVAIEADLEFFNAIGGHGPYSLKLYRHQITRTKTAWSAG